MKKQRQGVNFEIFDFTTSGGAPECVSGVQGPQGAASELRNKLHTWPKLVS